MSDEPPILQSLGNWLQCLSTVYQCEHKDEKMTLNGNSVRYAMLDGMPLFALKRTSWQRTVLIYDDKIEIGEVERWIKRKNLIGAKFVLVPTSFPVIQLVSACILFVACFFEGKDVSLFKTSADHDLDSMVRLLISNHCRLHPADANALCPRDTTGAPRGIWLGCILVGRSVSFSVKYDMSVRPFSLATESSESTQERQRDDISVEGQSLSSPSVADYVEPMVMIEPSYIKREEANWDDASPEAPHRLKRRWGDHGTHTELIALSEVKREDNHWDGTPPKQGRRCKTRWGDHDTELIEPPGVKREVDHWEWAPSAEQRHRRKKRCGDYGTHRKLIEPSDVKIEVDHWESSSLDQ